MISRPLRPPGFPSEKGTSRFTNLGDDMGKPPLGSGARFSQLKNKLSSQPGVTNPGALAASIGRKKYGGAKMEKMAEHGKQGNESLHKFGG